MGARCFFVFTLLIAYVAAEDKWVWNGKTAKAVRTGDRVRYGVFDPESLDDPYYRPELRPPHRELPHVVRPPPPPNQPPPYHPPPPPSHKPDSDPTSFEKCKCVHSFNCRSPGLLFGSCDAGKKFCCEKKVQEGRKDFRPDNEYPEVLAGPGGPVDHIKKPIDRPDHHPSLGSFAERPLSNGGYGQRPEGPLSLGGYGSRPGGSHSNSGYGSRPDRPQGGGGYGIRPDGSLGSASYGKPYNERPRY